MIGPYPIPEIPPPPTIPVSLTLKEGREARYRMALEAILAITDQMGGAASMRTIAEKALEITGP